MTYLYTKNSSLLAWQDFHRDTNQPCILVPGKIRNTEHLNSNRIPLNFKNKTTMIMPTFSHYISIQNHTAKAISCNLLSQMFKKNTFHFQNSLDFQIHPNRDGDFTVFSVREE